MFPLWIHWQFADFQSKVTSCRAGCTYTSVSHPFRPPLLPVFNFCFYRHRDLKKKQIKRCLYSSGLKPLNVTQWEKLRTRNPGHFYFTQYSSYPVISSQENPSPPSFLCCSHLLIFLLDQQDLGEGTLQKEPCAPKHEQNPLAPSVPLPVVLARPTILITQRQHACGCNITLFSLISSIPSLESLSIIGESMCATETAGINPN